MNFYQHFTILPPSQSVAHQTSPAQQPMTFDLSIKTTTNTTNMAAASASKAPGERFGEDLLNCLICLEPYKSPKVLPCLHSFCTQCLERHHDFYKLKNADRLSCPTCRELVTVPDKGVQGLRTDDAVARTRQLLGQLTDWDRSSVEVGCAGAEGGADDTGQLRADILHTVNSLHHTLSQLRSKLLQVIIYKNSSVWWLYSRDLCRIALVQEITEPLPLLYNIT